MKKRKRKERKALLRKMITLFQVVTLAGLIGAFLLNKMLPMKYIAVIGGGLFGVPGMFIGVPLFACFYTAVRTYASYRLRLKGLPENTASYYSHAPDRPEESADTEETS